MIRNRGWPSHFVDLVGFCFAELTAASAITSERGEQPKEDVTEGEGGIYYKMALRETTPTPLLPVGKCSSTWQRDKHAVA